MGFLIAYSKFLLFFSPVSGGRGDVLALGSPFEEKDVWKGKFDTMDLNCTNLQWEHVALHEEVKVTNSLNQDVEIHGFPSNMDSRVIDLEGFLKDAKKRYKVASDFVEDKALQIEEYRKTPLQVTEAHTEALEALRDKVGGLKRGPNDSLQQTMWEILEVREQVVKHVRRLCHECYNLYLGVGSL